MLDVAAPPFSTRTEGGFAKSTGVRKLTPASLRVHTSNPKRWRVLALVNYESRKMSFMNFDALGVARD
jgi:hypothetical protein